MVADASDAAGMSMDDDGADANSSRRRTGCAGTIVARPDAESRLVISQPLKRLAATVPGEWYHDPAHYRRELDKLWYRHWVYLCRSDLLPASGDYVTETLGEEAILVTRDEQGRVRGFHNTCRHRGSLLCAETAGRFTSAGIVCPYHAWTYGLDGELRRTPWRLPGEDFDVADFPLYRIAAAEWGGNVFVNLDEAAPPLEQALGDTVTRLHNWQPGALAVGHRERFDLDCNWKVFWENFQECYHCPGVHPELCRVVPVYGRGLVSPSDDSGRRGGGAGGEPGLADGAVTWSMDGRTELPALPGLEPAERDAGQTYGVLQPGWFMVGHLDYARSVRVLPRGPEQTELLVEWLFPPATLERADFDLDRAVAFGRLVVEQDGRACELNQRGLRSRRYDHGVLVPQEYYVAAFHQWLREALGGDDATPDRSA